MSKPNPKELYVGSLSYDATEYDLEKLFSVSGTVTSVHLITDLKTGEFKGCGYVRMLTEAQAKDAVDSLDGAMLIDRQITVAIANAQKMKAKGGGARWRPTPDKGEAAKDPAAKPAIAKPATAKAAPARPAPAKLAAGKLDPSRFGREESTKSGSTRPDGTKSRTPRPEGAKSGFARSEGPKSSFSKPGGAKSGFAKSGPAKAGPSRSGKR